MKNDKLMYVLIIIGIFIILGLGINIGLSINKEKPQEIDLYKEVEKLDNKNNKTIVNEEVNNSKVTEEPKKEETTSTQNKTNTSTKESTSTKINTTTSSINKNTSTSSTKSSTTTSKSNTTATIKSSNTSTSNQNVTDNNTNHVTEEEEPKFSLKDNIVINKLTETYNNVKNDIGDGSFKDKGKATFVSIVDFLFYDGTIDGVSFKELTGKGKEKALELANKIDNAIEKRAPGYKDTISEKKTKVLNKASELIKKGTTSLDNFLRNKLDSEDYNELIRAKNELVTNSKYAISFIKDNGSKIINSAIDKLDKWYQIWKNK